MRWVAKCPELGGHAGIFKNGGRQKCLINKDLVHRFLVGQDPQRQAISKHGCCYPGAHIVSILGCVVLSVCQSVRLSVPVVRLGSG